MFSILALAFSEHFAELNEDSLGQKTIKYPCMYFAKSEDDLAEADAAVAAVYRELALEYLEMLQFWRIFTEDQEDFVKSLGYDPEDLPFMLTVSGTEFLQLKDTPAVLPRLCANNFLKAARDLKDLQ